MKSVFFFFLTLIQTAAFAQEVVASKRVITPTTNTLERVCESPRSPLYKTENPFAHLQVELMTDYDTLNVNYNATVVKGVVKVTRDGKKPDVYPVLLAPRGNSRRQMCSAPPFRMQFIKDAIKQKIEVALTQQKITVESEGYLKAYYDALDKETVDKAADVEGVKDGVFKHLGDDVKVVTHCGTATWEFVGGATETEQYQKLHSEFAIYKILDNLKMPVESTRMAEIKYYKATGEAAYPDEKAQALPKLAFFREPPRSIAERCGLLSKPDTQDQTKIAAGYSPDPVAQYQMDFLNKFIFNNDYSSYGQNMNALYDSDGKKIIAPYDFDLSGLVVDAYFKNTTLEDQLNKLSSMLTGYDATMIRATVKRVVDAETAMRKSIAQSEMDAATQAKFNKWLDLYLGRLKTYQTENPVTP